MYVDMSCKHMYLHACANLHPISHTLSFMVSPFAEQVSGSKSSG